MNSLCLNVFNSILEYIEPLDCIKLTFISKTIFNKLNDCIYWRMKCSEYSIIINTFDIINLYYKYYNTYCYICKKVCWNNNYNNNYKICYNCNKIVICNKSVEYNFPNLSYIKYPFYLVSAYLYNLREYKFKIMINIINTNKKVLDTEFKRRKLTVPLNSKLCQDYVLSRTNIPYKQVCQIICQKKYIYEYTAFSFFKKFYYKVNYYNWRKSHTLALKMVLEDNKYPLLFPWENELIIQNL